jgi:hypothetical protein
MQLNIFERAIENTSTASVRRRGWYIESGNKVVNPSQVGKDVYFSAIATKSSFRVEDRRLEEIPTRLSGIQVVIPV